MCYFDQVLYNLIFSYKKRLSKKGFVSMVGKWYDIYLLVVKLSRDNLVDFESNTTKLLMASQIKAGVAGH